MKLTKEEALQAWKEGTADPFSDVKFEKPGDSVSGVVSNYLRGKFGAFVELDGKTMVPLSNKILADLFKAGITQKKLGLGVPIKITYIRRTEKAKHFDLEVDGEKIFTGNENEIRPLNQDELLDLL